jgi:hypothetical protein
MNELIRYDQARQLLRECATVDEAKDIRDKAAALAYYAKQRDDVEAAVWLSEIKLRAVQRIAEISRALPKAEAHGGKIWLPDGRKSKSETLADAGISTSSANEYEQLIGGPTEQGTAAAMAATEAYFAHSRAAQIPPTQAGLRAAVKSALDDALGPDPPRPKPKRISPQAAAFADWTGAVQTVAELDCDLESIARLFSMEDDLLNEAEAALPRLQRWIRILREVVNVETGTRTPA